MVEWEERLVKENHSQAGKRGAKTRQRHSQGTDDVPSELVTQRLVQILEALHDICCLSVGAVRMQLREKDSPNAAGFLL